MTSFRVLIVDGSLTTREVINKIVSKKLDDAEITSCGSGKEALEYLDKSRYDLVTTSLLLPDMDGLELCHQIRESDGHNYTPVIVISGDADSRLLKEGFNAGVTDYFDKSRGYAAFVDFIKEYSQRSTGLVGTVLYVEDSKTVATMTQRLFEKHGLHVTQTTTAEEAYKLLQQAKKGLNESYDLVITDFYLKDEMTGGDLLHAIRKRLYYSHQALPVLIITGKDDTKTQVEVFHAGANDFVGKPLVEETLMARVRSLLLIKHQYDALRRQAEKMELQSVTDSLTGAYNRRYLSTHGDEFLKNNRDKHLWIALLDIDHFKSINDTHGHLVGDQVLKELGSLLTTLYPNQMVVRYGGEEFAIFLYSEKPINCKSQSETLRNAVAELTPNGLPITISIGVIKPDDFPKLDANKLVGFADNALYAAKKDGRNCAYRALDDGTLVRLTDKA